MFAPTDDAFAKLGNTLNTLTPEQLSIILQYHVVNGFLLGPQITGTKSFATIEGQSITLTKTSQVSLKSIPVRTNLQFFIESIKISLCICLKTRAFFVLFPNTENENFSIII